MACFRGRRELSGHQECLMRGVLIVSVRLNNNPAPLSLSGWKGTEEMGRNVKDEVMREI